ncbi:MAG TPA: AMP-binding protein [Bryobacteraceae bacterium]|nr:AMP-binding protein [Bryobacteraceae bacterium]
MQPQVAWRPDEHTVARSRMGEFLRFWGTPSFDECYRRSIEDVEGFTEAVLKFLLVDFQKPYSRVLDTTQGAAWPVWCVGGQLNIAVTCLKHPDERLAVIWEGEEGISQSLTYGELRAQVNAFAAGLRQLGVQRGEAVAIHLPMVPASVVALLATALIGAVAVPLFSGYGPSAIASRIEDSGAKVLITFDEFRRRGATVRSAASAAECPTIKQTVVVHRAGGCTPDLFTQGTVASETTDAEDALIVLYTSGTTGKPKGIEHSHCGFPIKAAQDMCFGTDVGPGTRISWITDMGWMMGPWLIYGSLILGGTMVLYDGAPDFPDPGRLWRFAQKHGVEVFGLSPTLVRSLAAHGEDPLRGVDLSALRIFGSTGEPWNPEPWWWLFDRVGRGKAPIINYSGGTEISGGILMGSPLLPSKPCSFAAPCPGIAADVVDENGRPVATGAVGELVIRKPWIGQARGFWNDPMRYLDTYWSRWPELWAHGDWASRDEDGHWYIWGRSDDTLKIAGKRVGPAEVESILTGHGAVSEAAVVGVPHNVKGEVMVAFCVLAPQVAAGQELAGDLRTLVGSELGKPLRPDYVHFVPAIPKTRNGKVMRRVIRAAYLNQDAGDISALENPAALEIIRQARESQP